MSISSLSNHLNVFYTPCYYYCDHSGCLPTAWSKEKVLFPAVNPTPISPLQHYSSGVSTRQNHQSLNVTNKFHPPVVASLASLTGGTHSQRTQPLVIPMVIVISDYTLFSSRRRKLSCDSWANVGLQALPSLTSAARVHTRAHTHTPSSHQQHKENE